MGRKRKLPGDFKIAPWISDSEEDYTPEFQFPPLQQPPAESRPSCSRGSGGPSTSPPPRRQPSLPQVQAPIRDDGMHKCHLLATDHHVDNSSTDYPLPTDDDPHEHDSLTSISTVESVESRQNFDDFTIEEVHENEEVQEEEEVAEEEDCLLYTSPSPRDRQKSRMPSSA